MKYRHQYHAGNFADVHKHVTLLALLRAVQRKDKGLLYFETHAGRGWYDLRRDEAHAGAEFRQGYARIAGHAATAPEIQDYQLAERAACAAETGSPTDREYAAYAGSPLLAAQQLRAQDRAVCCEILAPECRALERALVPWAAARTQCSDGLQALSSHFPPPERRALVLIDPPYEDTVAELDSALRAIVAALRRLAGAVIALWYPIKDNRILLPWLRRCAGALRAPTLQSELWRYPRDSRVALNGSGLLIVNPPYQTDTRMAQWLPELLELLGPAPDGGTAVRWLIEEASQP